MRWETRKGAPIRHRERDAAIHEVVPVVVEFEVAVPRS